ncbi:helix-turn-helix transcriptional regulator [Streptomyces sp. NRRL S-495]|uniref:helix-turn-helix transcriptional regulator n=1 Tax=Streptomyces sp. NRRL S-495 TaxID=1609133 RepID=UPI0006991CB8|nr:helix-turn-helix transcriptional regulator [Streptomyces sp. NRRL S-495]
MPRPENPIPLDAPYRVFAEQLRTLRRTAGNPTLRAIARQAGYGPTVLSQATSGQRLPSLDVTLAYAVACGGDHDHWREQWLIARHQDEPANRYRVLNQPRTSHGVRTVPGFLQALRELRIWAGSPSFHAMARRVQVAPSTLCEAASPARIVLPTAYAVRSFVAACLPNSAPDSNEVKAWLATYHRLRAQEEARRPPRPQDDGGPGAPGVAVPVAAADAPFDERDKRSWPMVDGIPAERAAFVKTLQQAMAGTELSQRQLASLSNCSPGTLSRYLRGFRLPTLWNLEGLIDALQCAGADPDLLEQLPDLRVNAEKSTARDKRLIADLIRKNRVLREELARARASRSAAA